MKLTDGFAAADALQLPTECRDEFARIFAGIKAPEAPQRFECGECDAPPCIGKCAKVDVSGVVLTERQRDQRIADELRALNRARADRVSK